MIMTLTEHGIKRMQIEILYCRHRKCMYAEAFKVLKDKHLAEDAVHASIEKIIAGGYTFDDEEPGSTRNFFIIVSRNTAISMWNKLKKEKGVMFYTEDIDEACGYADSAQNPEEFAISEETIERIKGFIKELPPIYQDVLLLKLAKETSDEQTAKLLGISVETMKKRYTRAKEKLKKRIIEEKICEK